MDINKIMIAVDGSPLSIATMDQAVIMAERIKTDISMFFVEDINLRRLANLSHIKMISPFLESNHVLKEKEIDEIFKSQKIRLKKAISFAMSNKNIKHELVTKSGVVNKEILNEAKSFDLLIMSWSGWKAANYYFSTPYIHGKSYQNFSSMNKIELSQRTKDIITQKITSILIITGVIPNNAQILMYFNGLKSSLDCLDFVVRNISKMLGHLDLPFESGTKDLPINIVVKEDNIPLLKDTLKSYNRSATIIKTPQLSLKDLKKYIKETKSKMFIAHYNDELVNNLETSLKDICMTSTSFLMVK